jgi:hypothetical protein
MGGVRSTAKCLKYGLSVYRTSHVTFPTDESGGFLKIFSVFLDSSSVAAVIFFKNRQFSMPLVLCIQWHKWWCVYMYDTGGVTLQ